RADGEQALIYAIRNDEPPSLAALRPGLPAELCRIVERCLSKDMEKRYSDADTLLSDLRRLQSAAGTSADESESEMSTGAWAAAVMPGAAAVGAASLPRRLRASAGRIGAIAAVILAVA